MHLCLILNTSLVILYFDENIIVRSLNISALQFLNKKMLSIDTKSSMQQLTPLMNLDFSSISETMT